MKFLQKMSSDEEIEKNYESRTHIVARAIFVNSETSLVKMICC